MPGDHHASWLAGRSAELDDGGIPALLSAAREFPLTGIKGEALATALGYFEADGGKRSGCDCPAGQERPYPASDNGTHSDNPGQHTLPASRLHTFPAPVAAPITNDCRTGV
jgi:hypothetical protein